MLTRICRGGTFQICDITACHRYVFDRNCRTAEKAIPTECTNRTGIWIQTAVDGLLRIVEALSLAGRDLKNKVTNMLFGPRRLADFPPWENGPT